MQATLTKNWPCSAEQAFTLAAGVAQYPDFVPGWLEARVTSRNSNNAEVWQRLGFGPITMDFISVALFKPPHEISISSSNNTYFKDFHVHWLITPLRAGCRVTLSISADFRRPSFGLAAKPALRLTFSQAMSAFTRRATQLAQ